MAVVSSRHWTAACSLHGTGPVCQPERDWTATCGPSASPCQRLGWTDRHRLDGLASATYFYAVGFQVATSGGEVGMGNGKCW